MPTAAHLFALPNEIHLAEGPYFTVQAIYMGWWRLGLLWAAALLIDVALAVMLRGYGVAFWFATVSAALMAIVYTIYFIWTEPANAATANWTAAPANWETLRTQWEYSHAVNAGLIFLALCCVTIATVAARPRP
jgi:carbohydrate-selective porin OprB